MTLLGVTLTDGSILIAAVASMAPVVTVIFTARAARMRQEADWARQDIVAAQAKKDAEEQKRTQALLADEARRAAHALTERQEVTERRAGDVAQAAADAAELLRVTNLQIAEEAHRRQQDTVRLEGKLDKVHHLVNGKLTESLRAQALVLIQMIDLMTTDIVRLGTEADPAAVERRDVALNELKRLHRLIEDREWLARSSEEPPAPG